MRKLAAVLLGYIVSTAAAGPSLSESLEQCKRGGLLNVSESQNVDQIANAIERAKAQKEDDCKSAEVSVTDHENAAATLKASAENVGTALDKAMNRGDSAINNKLLEYDRQLQLLKQMGRLTRSDIVSLQSAYESNRQQVAKLASDWDQLFRPEPGGPLESLVKVSNNPILSAQVRAVVAQYLDAVPPYLLGKGSAPREKLHFLTRQENLVKQVLASAEQAFHQPFVDEAAKNIRKGLSADYATNIAIGTRARLLRKFSYRDVYCAAPYIGLPACSSWAQEARRSGACRLAKQEVKHQLNVLQSAIIVAPEGVKESMSATLAQDIEVRRQFLSETSCSSAQDETAIKKSLAQMQRSIALFCERKPEDLTDRAQGLDADIGAFFTIVDKLRGDEQVAIYNLAQELWTQAYFLRMTCQKATL